MKLNGCCELALTKLDVLSALKKIAIATHYLYKGKKLTDFPAEMNYLPDIHPLYTTFAGWQTSISNVKRYNDLPVNCRRYIEYFEKQLGKPIKYISVGKERKAVIRRI